MIETLLDQQRHDLGGSMTIGRLLPSARRQMVGPFIFFDHLGPMQLDAGLDRGADVRPHPHIGLSTVTYLFSGEIMHRDSLGFEQPIRAREVNWMVAGRGITHSERLERARAVGDHLHGIQSWIALPREAEEIAPSFSHHEGSDLPEWAVTGVHGHLIAGSAYGLTARAPTHSPLFYVHLELAPDAVAELPAGPGERAAYVATGAIELAGHRVSAGQMAVVRPGATSLRALEPSTVMLLGGEPVGERFLHWNFVSSSRDRLKQAAEDWKSGRMKLPAADDQELIPLPDGAPTHS